MKKITTLLLALFTAFLGFSQQDCEHAIDLTPGTQQCGTNDYLDPYGTFSDDGYEPTNPADTNYNDGEYWFKYVGNGKRLKLDVSSLSNINSGIFVFDENPERIDYIPRSNACIASKATTSDEDYSVTTPPLSTGHTYYIVIANYGTPDSTDFCLDATEIEVPVSYTCGDVFYDTGGEDDDYEKLVAVMICIFMMVME